MFPDSKITDIDCGRTKAGYVVRYALAPYVKEMLVDSLSGNSPFAIHVDESTYHGKIRLEFWVVHFHEHNRKVSYLATKELQTDLNVESFLEDNMSENTSLKDLKLVSAEAIYACTMGLLEEFSLNQLDLIHVMTDNCSTMRGVRDGFVAKMKRVCPNIIDIDGCCCHKGNLITKEVAKKFQIVKDVVAFVEALSNFIENRPKVRSILKQSSDLLQVNRIPDYCETRFLNLYLVVEAACHQFPVIEKLARLDSENSHMKECLNMKGLLINMDQFVIHLKPLHDFTRKTQSLNGNVYDLLLILLELVSKLLVRLGHNIPLSAKGYFKKLFQDGKNPLPFLCKSRDFNYSKNVPSIYKELCKADEVDLEQTQNNWALLNEHILRSMLVRFHPFLKSKIVRKCYVLFKHVKDFNDATLQSLKRLALEMLLPSSDRADEYAQLTLKYGIEDSSLTDLHKNGQLSACPLLTRLVEKVMVLSPHNMVVESRFSKMKFFETDQQSNFSLEMYNAFRLVSDFFDRDSFEDFEPPSSLMDNIKLASREYKTFCEENKEIRLDRIAEAEVLRGEIGVFKKKTSKELWMEMQAAEREIRDAEAMLEAAKRRKIELKFLSDRNAERQDSVSDSIISKMFRK